MSKKYGFLFMSAVLMTTLAACAPDRDEETEAGGEVSEGEEPDKPDSLHVWVNEEDDQIAAVQTIVERYEEETGIEVQLTSMDMFDQVENIALDGPAGSGPDIYFAPHDHTGNLAVQNLAEH
ncbi:extracellular solute-binding protein [Geomicrobium sp. JCM 19039]|uniref:extracellular solute-binding protein n=1 Tax=Geomicrobium sp. JCM 19039 TaxID=1460636 RepID=UPI0021009CC7|nr:extracellular solute-binding protein [Geomicrobium sp. JCM 19039]